MKTAHLRQSIQFLLKYFKHYKSAFVMTGSIMILSSLLILPFPFITRHIIDHTLKERNQKELVFLFMIVVISIALQKFFQYLYSYSFYRINRLIIYKIRLEMLQKFSRIPLTEINMELDIYLPESPKIPHV